MNMTIDNILFMLTILIIISLPSIDPAYSDELSDFCDEIENNKFENAGKYVNTYLNGLTTNYDPDDFNKGYKNNFDDIKSWLESFDCVTDVQYGDVIVKTAPPLKEFLISFEIDEKTITKMMDISLGSTLRVYRFH